VSTGKSAGVGLEESDGDRGAFGDDGEEMAARESEEKSVGFTDGRVGAGEFVEKRFIAEEFASGEFTERSCSFVEELNGSVGDEVDPVGYLSGEEYFFLRVVVVVVQFFCNGEEKFKV
jgi:hypothetical protein